MAQYVSLDTTFGNNGFTVNTDISQYPLEIFFENDKYLFVLETNGIYSKNYDGTINTAFGNNGKLFFNNANKTDIIKGAKFLNGFIYVFGTTVNSTGSTAVKKAFIAKVSIAGVLDTSFGLNGKAALDFGNTSECLNDIAIMDNGTIYATGYSNQLILLSKINSNGILDTSFNTTGYKTYPLATSEFSSGESIYLQGTDLLIVAASTFQATSFGIRYLALLKTDLNGQYISSFGTGGKKLQYLAGDSNSCTYSVKGSKFAQNNDDLFVYYITTCSGPSSGGKLAKYNMSTDAFVPQVVLMLSQYHYFTIDNNDKIYITGTRFCGGTDQMCGRKFFISRHNYDGTADLSFNQTGEFSHLIPPIAYNEDRSSVFYIHSDGKIVLSGRTYNQYSAFGFGLEIMRLVDSPTAPLSTDEHTYTTFSVFPNPAKTEININTVDEKTISEVVVYNILGKQVLSEKGNIRTLDIRDLPAGIYLLKIKAEKTESVLKFIKE